MNTKNNPKRRIETGIQSGDKTHHQDHVIILQSFNTINVIVSNVGKLPIWIEILDLSLIIYYI